MALYICVFVLNRTRAVLQLFLLFCGCVFCIYTIMVSCRVSIVFGCRTDQKFACFNIFGCCFIPGFSCLCCGVVWLGVCFCSVCVNIPFCLDRKDKATPPPRSHCTLWLAGCVLLLMRTYLLCERRSCGVGQRQRDREHMML